MRSVIAASVFCALSLVGLGGVVQHTLTLRPTVDYPEVVFASADELAEFCGIEPTPRGCYAPRTDPNKVFVFEGLRGEVREFVILHEVGHFMRPGQGECAADAYAYDILGTPQSERRPC